MKKEIYQDTELLKRILCYSSAPQAIAVTEEMVDYLFKDSNEVILLTGIGQSLSEIVTSMTIEDAVNDVHQKIIVLVRTPEEHQLTVSELSHISNLVAQFPTEIDVCYGMATSKEQDNKITLLIAIS